MSDLLFNLRWFLFGPRKTRCRMCGKRVRWIVSHYRDEHSLNV